MSRIHKYMVDLQDKFRKECNNFSEDVKYWTKYTTDIKEFLPWLTSVEADSTNGLANPSSLQERRFTNPRLTVGLTSRSSRPPMLLLSR